LEVPKASFWSWNVGQGWNRERLTPGRILVMPPHTTSQWDVESSRRNVILLVPAKTIATMFGAAAPPDLKDAFAPLTVAAWEDPFIQAMIIRLWEASDSTQVTDRMSAEGFLTAITSQLLKRAGMIGSGSDRFALSPSHMRRVTCYVEDNLHKAVDVVSMANVTGLSERHFARAFRLQTGETPHNWLMERRIERAKKMLKDSDADCQSIWSLCGFSSHSHFTLAMRKRTGETPSRWRKKHS
jgi:AraC family transcriptional regulator